MFSIPIIHHPNVSCYITIDISLRRTHISFDLDVLLILPVIVLKQREETFNESLVSSGTTLTEYPTIFCPIKLHSYPAPCQRPRIQQKPKVHCGGGRQLPFYQDKGKQLSHLTRSTSSIRQNSKRSRYVISTQPCTMLQTFSLTATLFTFRRDTTYRLILIIAPRRRDASNRLPTLSRGIQLQSIENRSTTIIAYCYSSFILRS